MPYLSKSYLSSLIVGLGLTITALGARAQTISLDPNIEYITTGVGTEFVLELKVDAAVTSMRSFTYYVDFDGAKLDTVEVTEGPLFPSSGGTTYFFKYIVGDTSLQLEGTVFGAGLDVSGPGVLATIRIKTLDTGYVNMAVEDHRIRDINANLISSTAEGAEIYIDIPPDEFNLVSPVGGETVSRFPGETFDFTWNSSSSLYPGDNVEYTLTYARDPAFVVGATSVSGLTDTVYSLLVDGLTSAKYYWNVTAQSSLYGFDRVSTPAYDSLDFMFAVTEPTDFDLVWPLEAGEVDVYGHDYITFDWGTSESNVPNDTITYIFYLGPDSDIPTGAIIVDTVKHLSEIDIESSLLPRGEWVYWTVNAENGFDLNTWAGSKRSAVVYSNCDLDHSGGLDITDLQRLIDYQFLTLTPPFPENAANCDCQGGVDITDVQRLVDNQFLSLAPLPVCQ